MSSKGKMSRNIPEFVFINLDSMKTIRRTLKISRADVAKATHISTAMLEKYELRSQFPIKERYNALANFFDWEIWE